MNVEMRCCPARLAQAGANENVILKNVRIF